MKKQIFTLLILIGLVGFSSKLFAQGSTPVAPYEGATHNYVVNGLTPGDRVTMGISSSATVYTDNVVAAPTSFSSKTQSPSGTLAQLGAGITTASLQVIWGADAGNTPTTFYIWIQIQDSEGCSTYRNLPVTPVNAPATPYVVDFTVTALNVSGDATTTAANILAADASDYTVENLCPVFEGEDWTLSTPDDATTNDGSSYVYFRVNRHQAASIISSWTFTPEVSGTITNLEISTDAANWSALTNNAAYSVTSTVSSVVNVVYVRALITNGTFAQTITLDIDSPDAFDAGGLYHDAETAGVGSVSNVASVEVNPLPTVGTFGLSN